MREVAREIFVSALKNASIEKAFARHVHCERGVLRICRRPARSRFLLPRVRGFDRQGGAYHGRKRWKRKWEAGWKGLSLRRSRPPARCAAFRYFQGGHPTPTAESIQAADAILKSLDSLNAAALVIFMLSGGGSSIVEKPVDDEISLPDLIATYRTLVHSGAPIAEINAIRKHLSAVKGGRLAQAAYPAQQVSILVSDVPEATPDALASGPTMPDSTSLQDCERIAAKYGLIEQFPKSVADLFRQHVLEETPKSDDPAFVHARWWTVLSNKVAVEEAAVAATQQGFAVEVDNSCDDWDYEKAADYLVEAGARVAAVGVAGVPDLGRRGDGQRTQRRHRRAQSAICAGVRGKDCRGRYHRPERWHRRD